MIAAIVKKAFDNYDKNSTFTFFNYISIFEKLALKAFNQLFHDYEISRLLIINHLLNFFNYYF